MPPLPKDHLMGNEVKWDDYEDEHDDDICSCT